MRLKIKSIGDGERLARLFEESHIEHRGNNTYLVVDRVKRRRMALA